MKRAERDAKEAREMERDRRAIEGYEGPPIRIMEVCGTHTHEIFRLGLRALLPPSVRLIAGPGCPVCVTPADYIDEAIFLAQKGVTVATFGDLVRVPGSATSLAEAKGRGAHVEIVYTPLDAVAYAASHPKEDVVFLSVGFETTTPAALLSLRHALAQGLENYALLMANKTMPAAYRAMAGYADAFLYPGHVCAITGTAYLQELALRPRPVSGVVAGFTAAELLGAIARILCQPSGRPFFENCYKRVVRAAGSPAAQHLVTTYTEPVDARWRGLGIFEGSGLSLRAAYAAFDARKKYAIEQQAARVHPACRCGEILRGTLEPPGCPLFGTACTPAHPVGACMVASEGTCAAFHRYARGGAAC